jgi:hypothetical protein
MLELRVLYGNHTSSTSKSHLITFVDPLLIYCKSSNIVLLSHQHVMGDGGTILLSLSLSKKARELLMFSQPLKKSPYVRLVHSVLA